MALLRDVALGQAAPVSKFDLSRRNRFATNPGWLTPCLTEELYPGDVVELSTEGKVFTAPLKSPLMGSFMQEVAYFWIPSRLYVQAMDTNRMMFDPSKVLYPRSYPPTIYMLETSRSSPLRFGTSDDPVILYDGFSGSDQGAGAVYDDPNDMYENYWSSGIAVAPMSLPELLNIQPVDTVNFYFGQIAPATGGNLVPFYPEPEPVSDIPVIGYYDIFRNYYANTQEADFYIASPGFQQTYTPDRSKPIITKYRLSLLDAFIGNIVASSLLGSTNDVSVGDYMDSDYVNSGYESNNTIPTTPLNSEGAKPFSYAASWDYIFGAGTSILCPSSIGYGPSQLTFGGYLSMPWSYPFAGCVLRAHRPDLFTAWLSSDTYADMVEGTSINIENNSLTINQIRMGNHLMEYDERGLIGGGRYADWVMAEFNVHTSRSLCIPELLGVHRSDIVFDEITSLSNAQAAGETGETGLGDLGGKGTGYLHGMPIRFTATEHGYLMAIYSIVPNVSYGNFRKQMYDRLSFQDLYAPKLDHIGFQPLQVKNVNISLEKRRVENETSLVPSYYYNESIGYQPAYTELTTAVDEVHGDLVPGQDLDAWAISRNFVPANTEVATIDNYESSFNGTSYILPGEYAYPFVDNSETARNFIVQLGFDFSVKRLKSKSPMPTLA